MIDNLGVGVATGGLMTYLLIQIKDNIKNIDFNTSKLCDTIVKIPGAKYENGK